MSVILASLYRGHYTSDVRMQKSLFVTSNATLTFLCTLHYQGDPGSWRELTQRNLTVQKKKWLAKT